MNAKYATREERNVISCYIIVLDTGHPQVSLSQPPEPESSISQQLVVVGYLLYQLQLNCQRNQFLIFNNKDIVLSMESQEFKVRGRQMVDYIIQYLEVKLT